MVEKNKDFLIGAGSHPMFECSFDWLCHTHENGQHVDSEYRNHGCIQCGDANTNGDANDNANTNANADFHSNTDFDTCIRVYPQ